MRLCGDARAKSGETYVKDHQGLSRRAVAGNMIRRPRVRLLGAWRLAAAAEILRGPETRWGRGRTGNKGPTLRSR